MRKKLLSSLGLSYMVCFMFALFSVEASAQRDSAGAKNSDKDLAAKKGVSESLASGPKKRFNPETGNMELIAKEADPNKPTSTQVAIGLGSIPVAFIVLKYL